MSVLWSYFSSLSKYVLAKTYLMQFLPEVFGKFFWNMLVISHYGGSMTQAYGKSTPLRKKLWY